MKLQNRSKSKYLWKKNLRRISDILPFPLLVYRLVTTVNENDSQVLNNGTHKSGKELQYYKKRASYLWFFLKNILNTASLGCGTNALVK